MNRILIIIVVTAVLSSCALPQGKQRQGTIWGAGGGGIAGGIIGAFTKGEKGAIWGAFIGATLGGLAGNQVGAYMDRQEAEFSRVLANSEAASSKREGDAVIVSFKGDVYFDTGKSVIKPRMYSEIDRVANVLRNYPKTWIQVGGYADPRGSEALNLQLSQLRADAVANELIKRGINTSRIRPIGFGEDQSVSNGDPNNYALDRRVDLVLTPMIQAVQIM